jgi:ankyrin repeat protein
VSLLLERGGKVNRKDKQGRTALMFAARNGHVLVAKKLLAAAADVNARSQDDWTALKIAEKNGHKEIVELL